MSKPTLVYLFPANKGIQDNRSGLWSYVEVFAYINIPSGLDFTITDFHISGKINNVPGGKTKVTIQVVNPEGQVHSEIDMEGSLEPGDMTVNAQFDNVRFSQPGKYCLKAVFNGEQLADNDYFYFEVRK
jgi:hypothetical protein